MKFLFIGLAALGLVGMAWSPNLEGSSSAGLAAVVSEDSVVSLLQVSGKKKVADNKTTDAGPERPRALNVTLASQQIGGQRQRPHWWSLAEVKQTLRNAVRGREVPSAEAMLFTAGLIAAIMVVAVALALLYQRSRQRTLAAVDRQLAASSLIPGQPETADAMETTVDQTSAMSTAEVPTGSMRKPKPACC